MLLPDLKVKTTLSRAAYTEGLLLPSMYARPSPAAYAPKQCYAWPMYPNQSIPDPYIIVYLAHPYIMNPRPKSVWKGHALPKCLP